MESVEKDHVRDGVPETPTVCGTPGTPHNMDVDTDDEVDTSSSLHNRTPSTQSRPASDNTQRTSRSAAQAVSTRTVSNGRRVILFPFRKHVSYCSAVRDVFIHVLHLTTLLVLSP